MDKKPFNFNPQVAVAFVIILGFLWYLVDISINRDNIEQEKINSEIQEIEEKNKNIVNQLTNIKGIEGQKITQVNDKFITLQNGKQIANLEGDWTDCQVGDVIADYDLQKDSIVCQRQKNGVKSFHYLRNYNRPVSDFYGSNFVQTPEIDEYKNAKKSLQNQGVSYNIDEQKYKAANGTVFFKDAEGKITQNMDEVTVGSSNKKFKDAKKSGRGGIFSPKSGGKG